MKVQIAWLSLGLALGSIVIQPAHAADFGNSGGSTRTESYRDVGVPAAIPVPAPVPIPEYRGGWYFRFDAGVGVISQPSFTEEGFIYGKDDGPGPVTGPADPITLSTSWFNGDFDTFSTVGAGLGYTFGSGWRGDLTVEKRSLNTAQIDGSDSWSSYDYSKSCGGCMTYALIDANKDGIGDRRTTIKVNDRTKLDGTIWMANAYYDLFTSHGFTPYVGAGAGVMWNVITRKHESDVSTCDTTTVPSCATQVAVSSTVVDKALDRATLAGALMAGVSYDISDITTIDVGYRYLHLGGTEISMDINGDHSHVKIGDQNVHQVRAGLRFNFN